jgi:hypothetical protein
MRFPAGSSLGVLAGIGKSSVRDPDADGEAIQLFHPANVHSRGPSIGTLANFEGEMIALLQLVGIDATDAQCVHVHKDVRPARGVFNETESTIGKPGFQSSSGH